MASLKKAMLKINSRTEMLTKFYDFFQQYESAIETINPLREEGELHFEDVKYYEGQRTRSQFKASTSLPNPDLAGASKYAENALTILLTNFGRGHLCFVGPAGIGKTTLLKSICRRVSRGKCGYPVNSVVHFLQCRHRGNSIVSVGEFLFDGCDLTEDERRDILILMRDHPDRMIIIIDSLDSLQYTIDGVYENVGIWDRACPEAILANLLSGNLCGGCRYITSSRELFIRNFQGKLRPDKVLAISGFTHQALRKITVEYLGEEESRRFIEHLEINVPTLLPLCNVPILFIYVLMAYTYESDFKPSTITGCLGVVLQNNIRSEHVHQGSNIQEVMHKLEELCHRGNIENRIYFTRHDLESLGLDVEATSDIAIVAPGNIGGKLLREDKDLLFFPHQTMQEMLGAIWVVKMKLEDFEVFVSNQIHQERFVVVRRFVCGLLLDDELHQSLSEDILLKEPDHDEKVKILLGSLQRQLARNIRNRRLLELFISLKETNRTVTDIVRSDLKIVNFNNAFLTMSDSHVIGSVLALADRIDCFQINNCDLTTTKLEIIWKAMEDSLVKVESFILENEVKIGTDGFRIIGLLATHCEVKKLGMVYCQLQCDHIAKLSSSVAQSDKLKQLVLDGNRSMGIDGFREIGKMTLRHDFDRIDLDRCDLSTEEISALADSIEGADKLQSVHLTDERECHDDDVRSLARILPSVSDKLWLVNWDIEERLLRMIQNELDRVGNQGLNVFLTYQDSLQPRPPSERDDDQINSILESMIATIKKKRQIGSLPEDIAYSSEVIENETWIGPAGGAVSAGDCKVTFLPNSIPEKRRIRVSMTMNFNSIDLLPDLIPTTPFFTVEYDGSLTSSAIVQLPTWYQAEHCISKIYKRRRSSVGSRWDAVDADVTAYGYYLEFNVNHFCGIIGALQTAPSSSPGTLYLHHCLMNNGRNFASIVCYSVPDETLMRHKQGLMSSRGYEIVTDNHTTVDYDDSEIDIRIESLESHLYTFRPNSRYLKSSDINRAFTNTKTLTYILKYLRPPVSEHVDLQYIVGPDDFIHAAKVSLKNFSTEAIEKITKASKGTKNVLNIGVLYATNFTGFDQSNLSEGSSVDPY